MWTKLPVLLLVLLLFPANLCPQGGTAVDEKAIRDVETQWETAWNHHDVAAMSRLFAMDADVINLAGEWFHGREAFAKDLEGLHSGKVRESVWQTEKTDMKFVAPDTAVVHTYFNSHGDNNPDGTPMPPRRGILTRVEVKRDGRWLILASQATNIVPPATASAIRVPNQRAGD
jgi:uncharacterized protein (TIGR02246 family)